MTDDEKTKVADKNKANMTDKAKADVLLHLMDAHWANYRQTRDIEFKVNIAIWTALIVCGKFLSDQNFHLNSFGKWLLFIILFLLVTICHYHLWMRPIQSIEDRDSGFAKGCLKEVQSLAKTDIERSETLHRWTIFEVGFSGIILIFWAVILA